MGLRSYLKAAEIQKDVTEFKDRRAEKKNEIGIIKHPALDYQIHVAWNRFDSSPEGIIIIILPQLPGK